MRATTNAACRQLFVSWTYSRLVAPMQLHASRRRVTLTCGVSMCHSMNILGREKNLLECQGSPKATILPHREIPHSHSLTNGEMQHPTSIANVKTTHDAEVVSGEEALAQLAVQLVRLVAEQLQHLSVQEIPGGYDYHVSAVNPITATSRRSRFTSLEERSTRSYSRLRKARK